MKKVIAVLVGLPMLALMSCSQTPSVPKAEAEFCKNLADLQVSLKTLSNITPTSKVGDVKKAQAAVVKNYNELKKSAAKVEKAKTDKLEKAYADLDKTVKGIPNKDTLAQAAATVKPKVQAVEAARAQLQSTVNCPAK